MIQRLYAWLVPMRIGYIEPNPFAGIERVIIRGWGKGPIVEMLIQGSYRRIGNDS